MLKNTGRGGSDGELPDSQDEQVEGANVKAPQPDIDNSADKKVKRRVVGLSTMVRSLREVSSVLVGRCVLQEGKNIHEKNQPR